MGHGSLGQLVHRTCFVAAQALKLHDALVKAQPMEPWFLVFRGVAFRNLGLPPMLEKARLDFEKAISLWPTFRAAWNQLGYTYVAQGKANEALVRFLIPRVPHFMVPRYVRVMPSLPKTPTNKIRKIEIRQQGVTDDCWDRVAQGIEVRRMRLE